MIEKKVRFFLFVGFFVLGLVSVSASFDFDDNDDFFIKTDYSLQDTIEGWINISFNEHPSNSSLSDSFGNSISLIDLLRLNTELILNRDYNCSSKACDVDYNATHETEEKSFNLKKGETKLVGFKFDENMDLIKNISFILESNVGTDCNNQLFVDFFDDDKIDILNEKVGSSICAPTRYSCFNESKWIEKKGSIIQNKFYCQRFTFPSAPGFKIGLTVFGENTYEDDLIMSLRSVESNYQELANCNISKPVVSSSDGVQVSCQINYSVLEPTDYYVCVRSEGSEESDLQIRYYEDREDGCGFFSDLNKGTEDEVGAYDFFINSKAFGSFGEIEIINSLPFEETSLSDMMEIYIENTYGSLDCSNSPCVVPIRFIFGANQQVDLRDLKISYEGAAVSEETNFYDLNETSAKITTDNKIKISLNNANFAVPNKYDTEDYKFYLDGKKIFDKSVSIEKDPIVIRGLVPETTAYGFSTYFEVIGEFKNKIVSSKWNFGNGDVRVNSSNGVFYTYNTTGSYFLNVTIVDSVGNNETYYKNINVRSPETEITNNLNKKQESLGKLGEQIGEFSSFEQRLIKESLDWASLDANLTALKSKFASASSNDYNEIISLLFIFKIPESITITKVADSISFFPSKDYVDLDILQKIGGGSYRKNDIEKYLEAILLWGQNTLNSKINFKEFSAKYDNIEVPFIRTFELDLRKKDSSNLDSFLVFQSDSMENLEFQESYGKKKEGDYTYIPLKTASKKIAFGTTDDIDFSDLPLFIAPSLDKIEIQERIEDKETKDKMSKWTLFILIVSLLILLGIASYVVLQIWYKKKYENYLFKNKNHLYNLIVYINNLKKQGVNNKEIIKNLKKAKWSSEQISYVMKKYAGKRTGLPEIPVAKFFKKNQKSNNIDNNMGGKKFYKV